MFSDVFKAALSFGPDTDEVGLPQIVVWCDGTILITDRGDRVSYLHVQ